MILEAVGREKLFEITANTAMAGAMSGTSMLWIKRNLPEVYEKTKYFGHVNTLLAQRMSGNFAIDYSNASYTDLFETTGGFQWSEVLCEKIGIDMEKLPPLHASTDVVGGLIHPDLIRMGIPRDTPVIIGGGDTACATLAAGVTKAGQVCESVGTTNVLTICVDQPKFDKGFINRCHVVEGTWIYQGALSHTGASYQWFRDNFCQDLVDRAVGTDKTAFQFMNEEADMAEPGSGGLVFLPYMLGERSPISGPLRQGRLLRHIPADHQKRNEPGGHGGLRIRTETALRDRRTCYRPGNQGIHLHRRRSQERDLGTDQSGYHRKRYQDSGYE